MKPLTAKRLRELFAYDANTGVFTRRVRRQRYKVGSVAGYMRHAGYRAIRIDGTHYYQHRLAWLYMHGEWPAGIIDHINADPSDNRIANLRVATPSQNQMNLRSLKRNASGYRGVYRDRNSWSSQITFQGKVKFVGSFKTPEAAYAAYCKKGRELFGEFFNV